MRGARLAGEYSDLRDVLRRGALSRLHEFSERAPDLAEDDIRFLPVIPNASKILCVGINYMGHIRENRSRRAHSILSSLRDSPTASWATASRWSAPGFSHRLRLRGGNGGDHRQTGPPRAPRPGHGPRGRLHLLQRRQRARLPVPHHSVHGRQELLPQRRPGTLDDDPGRAARPGGLSPSDAPQRARCCRTPR